MFEIQFLSSEEILYKSQILTAIEIILFLIYLYLMYLKDLSLKNNYIENRLKLNQDISKEITNIKCSNK